MTEKPKQTERTGRTGRFDNSRKRVDATLVASVALTVMAILVGGKESMVVVATVVPSMLALVGGWTYVTNKAEVDLPVLPMQKPPEGGE